MKLELAGCRSLRLSRCCILIVTFAIVLVCVSAVSANKKPPLRPVKSEHGDGVGTPAGALSGG